MSSSKIIDLYRDFAAGVYVCVAWNPIPLPPLHMVYVYTVYLFTQGMVGDGGGEGEREGERGNSSQSWVKNTNMTVSPVYKL